MIYLRTFNENIWEEWEKEELDDSFMVWLEQNYPDKSKWDEITEIKCDNSRLYSLHGIDKLINLKYLYCQHNVLTSLEGIEKSTNLRHLWCYDNNLTSIKGIDNLTKLKYFHCHYNNLTSLEGIENLTELKYLYCHHNNFNNQEKNRIKQFCRKNRIYIEI